MIRTLIKNWWLLGLRGVLALLFSATAFLMQSSAESFTLREFAVRGMIIFLGILGLGTGVCTVAAGVWGPANEKWRLLIMDGLAVSTIGLVMIFLSNISFGVVMYLLVALATAIGAIELSAARTLRHHIPDEWFLGLAGIASIGFAVIFLAIGAERVGSIFIWLGCYSGFSAICMLGLATRLHNLQTTIHRIAHHAKHHG